MAIDVGRLSNRQLLFLINSHRDRGTTGETTYTAAVEELNRREVDRPRLRIVMSLRQLLRFLGQVIAGIMIVAVLIWFTVMFAVLPVIGLVTGDLYLPGKRPGLGTDIHGIWSRLISAALLMFFVYGARSFLKLFLTRLRRFKAAHSRTAVIGVWVAIAVMASLAGLVILGMIVGDNS